MIRRLLLLGILLLPSLGISAPLIYIEGVDYERFEQKTPQQKMVSVMEFFSYGCPWCYHLEPALRTWLDKKPKDVTFKRIPVVFNPVWEKYARAYYVLEAMDQDERLSPELFRAIQDEHRNFKDGNAFGDYLQKFGLDKEKFVSIYDGSPGLDAKLSEAQTLLKQFKVWGVPCIVVNNEYITDSRMSNGDNQRMMDIVSYLVELAKKSKRA